MRFHIEPISRAGFPRYSAQVGDLTVEIKRHRPILNMLSLYVDWQFHWPRRGNVRVRLPGYGVAFKRVWSILLDDETICEGELRQSFLPSRDKGIHWRFQGETFRHQRLPRMRIMAALLNQHKVIACWNPPGCYLHLRGCTRLKRVEGVIHPSLSPDAVIAVFGIIVAALVHEDSGL